MSSLANAPSLLKPSSSSSGGASPSSRQTMSALLDAPIPSNKSNNRSLANDLGLEDSNDAMSSMASPDKNTKDDSFDLDAMLPSSRSPESSGLKSISNAASSKTATSSLSTATTSTTAIPSSSSRSPPSRQTGYTPHVGDRTRVRRTSLPESQPFGANRRRHTHQAGGVPNLSHLEGKFDNGSDDSSSSSDSDVDTLNSKGSSSIRSSGKTSKQQQQQRSGRNPGAGTKKRSKSPIPRSESPRANASSPQPSGSRIRDRSNITGSGSGSGSGSVDVSSLEKQLSDTRGLLATEQSHRESAEAKLAEKTSEISRLSASIRDGEDKAKRESISRAEERLKNMEETAELRRKAGEEMEELRKQHAQDDADARKSHEEALARLKAMHLGELAEVKQRTAEADFLDKLASQIKHSSGTLKLLETEMRKSKVMMDAGRESQMEARERLISEMESSAKESVERAEAQAVRLQGSISGVEDVMRSLRNQNVDERERLRSEHSRLESLQTALVAERKSFQESAREERAAIGERWAAYENEKRRGEEELARRREEIDREMSVMKRERIELKRLKDEASRAAEAQIAELKSEEEKLNNARSALARDVGLFEQRQATARGELVAAETARIEIQKLRKEIDEDTEKLDRKGRELHKLGKAVEEKGKEAERMMAKAASVKEEGINSGRAALAAKNQVDAEREALNEERKKMESERLSMSHERMTLIRDQASNRQLNMKLNSAITIAGTSGGRSTWQGLNISNTAYGSGGVSGGQWAQGKAQHQGISKESLAGLRSQVDAIASSYTSDFEESEKQFMEKVKNINVGADSDGLAIAQGGEHLPPRESEALHLEDADDA